MKTLAEFEVEYNKKGSGTPFDVMMEHPGFRNLLICFCVPDFAINPIQEVTRFSEPDLLRVGWMIADPKVHKFFKTWVSLDDLAAAYPVYFTGRKENVA